MGWDHSSVLMVTGSGHERMGCLGAQALWRGHAGEGQKVQKRTGVCVGSSGCMTPYPWWSGASSICDLELDYINKGIQAF